MQQPVILFIHNTYLKKGGEDSVVQQEIAVLKQQQFNVHYLEFNNLAYQKQGIGKLFLPLQLFFNLAAWWRVYIFVKKNKVDIVHVHNFYYTASPSVFWAAKAAGAHTLLTLHNYRLFCLNGIFYRDHAICMDCHTSGHFKKGIEAKCFKSSRIASSSLAHATVFHRRLGTWRQKVDGYIAINPLLAQLIQSQGIPAGKIWTKPNFVRSADFPGFHHFENRGDFYLFAGRLTEEKGIRDLVAVFKENGKRLVIAGDGPLADWINSLAVANIEYKGAIPREALFLLYSSCKALLFPSRWLEGLPMTIIEAQSTGAIVIAAVTATTEQMVTHGSDGFLYRQGDAPDLAKLITQFESFPENLKKQVSEAAYHRFQQHYTEENYLREIKKIYNAVINYV